MNSTTFVPIVAYSIAARLAGCIQIYDTTLYAAWMSEECILMKTPLKCGIFNSSVYVESSIFVNALSGTSMLNTSIANSPSEELEYECALGILEVCFIQRRILASTLC